MTETVFQPGDKVLRRAQVADILGTTPKAVDRLRQRGILPAPIRLGARAVGWPDRVIYEWLNTRPQA